jgi:hypothetical protein
MKQKIIISLLVLALPIVVIAQQTMRLGGGLISISRLGAVVIKSRADKTIELQGNTAITGTLAVSGATTHTGALAQTGALTLGSGTAMTRLAYYTATLTPAEVAADTCAEQLFTVTGVVVGDAVFVNKPTAQAGLGIAGVRVSAANQVGINFCNTTVAGITPTAAQSYIFGVMR